MELGNWWEAVLGLFFPTSGFCRLCWREYQALGDKGVCPECTRIVLESSGPGKVCRLCGRFTEEDVCPNCRGGGLPELEAVVAVVPYQGVYREMVQDLKYGGKAELARPMGNLMGQKYRSTYPTWRADAIIPVPLEPHRQLERGFNQSELLALQVGRALHTIVLQDGLFRGAATPTQSALGRGARLQNTRGAFYCREGLNLTGKSVLLVDDVVTTGATLASCAAALGKAGVSVIRGLTWAGGIRQNPMNSAGKVKGQQE